MVFADLTLRPARDEDAAILIDLVGGCFAPYPGCELDLDFMDASLKAIASYVGERNGEIWLVFDGDQLVGSGGYIQERPDRIELIKLYVRDSHRRRGLASALLNKVRQVAERKGLGMDLWTDTRFVEAHHFYTRHGFIQQPEIRSFDDPSKTSEYQFILAQD